MLRSLLVLCDQHCENRSQKHENERLHKSHEHFEEIEGNWQDRREPWIHGRHCFENAFAGINISEQSKTERDRSKHNRDHFEPANGEKDDDHQDLHDTGRLTFWAKQMFQESSDAVGLNRPDKPHHEEYGRHRGRHVQIRVATAQQRPIDMEISRTVVVTPADCSDSRNQSEPVHEQNKNENCSKKPKSLLHEVTADDVFPKILKPVWDGLNLPGRYL